MKTGVSVNRPTVFGRTYTIGASDVAAYADASGNIGMTARCAVAAPACRNSAAVASGSTSTRTVCRPGSHFARRNQVVDFGELRDAAERAEPRAAHCRGGIGKPQNLLGRRLAQQRVDERRAEHVPGTGRVDGVDVEGGYVVHRVAVE